MTARSLISLGLHYSEGGRLKTQNNQQKIKGSDKCYERKKQDNVIGRKKTPDGMRYKYE